MNKIILNIGANHTLYYVRYKENELIQTKYFYKLSEFVEFLQGATAA